jgi:hypothetical protein
MCHPGGRAGGAGCGIRSLWLLTFTVVGDLTEFHVPKQGHEQPISPLRRTPTENSLYATTWYSLLTRPLG